MRHETKARRACALNQSGQRCCGDRLIAHQADADHSFSGEGEVNCSFVGCGGPTADKLNQPRDLDPELPGDQRPSADDAINPSIDCVQARVEAYFGVRDVLDGHRLAVLENNAFEILARHHAPADLPINGKKASEIGVLVRGRFWQAVLGR
jgi:hypothetical protein